MCFQKFRKNDPSQGRPETENCGTQYRPRSPMTPGLTRRDEIYHNAKDKFFQCDKCLMFFDYQHTLVRHKKYNHIDLTPKNMKPESDDKIFTSLSCWKVTKQDNDTPPQSQPTQMQEPQGEVDKLPF